MGFYRKSFLNSSIIIPILLGLILSPVLFFTTAKANSFPTSVTVTFCGNNVKETGEDCDGSDLDGQTCTGLGYAGGTLTCNVDCTFNTSACTSGGGGGGGGGGGAPSETKVIIKGKAYPKAYVTLLSDGKVESTEKADSSANFKIEVSDISPGVWTFSLWAEDKEGRRSITFSFTTSVVKDMTTTVSGIFLPPTIELSKVNLKKGEFLDIFGQTAPLSEVSIHIESEEIIKTTEADTSGDWLQQLATNVLSDGMHTTRAQASSGGLDSSFSKVLTFYIGEGLPGVTCPNADLNGDGRVNLIDFSVLLYWWGLSNSCADQNQNGKVDLPDFSIMMYYWTG
jgi:hypothetical protein